MPPFIFNHTKISTTTTTTTEPLVGVPNIPPTSLDLGFTMSVTCLEHIDDMLITWSLRAYIVTVYTATPRQPISWQSGLVPKLFFPNRRYLFFSGERKNQSCKENLKLRTTVIYPAISCFQLANIFRSSVKHSKACHIVWKV